jgi:hypothetical protein
MIRDRDLVRANLDRVLLVHTADGFGSPSVNGIPTPRTQRPKIYRSRVLSFFSNPTSRWRLGQSAAEPCRGYGAGTAT